MHFVPAVVTAKIGRQALVLQKHSPTLLLAAGIVGVTGATVLACRATLKMDQILGDAEIKKHEIAEFQRSNYSEEDRQHDLTLLRVQTARDIVIAYGPAAILGGFSVAALVSSHRILSSRNAALGAAYAAIDTAFRQYRARVVERYGEKADYQFRHGTEKWVVEQKGTGKKAKVDVPHSHLSGYARYYDDACPDWEPDPETNLHYLKCQQNWFNDRLKAKGHVFLNEVYDALGLERSREGQIVGWLYGNPDGDDYISFGVFEGQTENSRDFVNGRNGAVLIDPNVDGIIFDKISSVQRRRRGELGRGGEGS